MKKITLAFAASMVMLTIITLPSCDQSAVVPKHYMFDTTGGTTPNPPTATLTVTVTHNTQLDQSAMSATVRVFLTQEDMNNGTNQLFSDQEGEVSPFTGIAKFTLPSPKGEDLAPCSSGKPGRTYYVYAFSSQPSYVQGNGSKEICATGAHPFNIPVDIK